MSSQPSTSSAPSCSFSGERSSPPDKEEDESALAMAAIATAARIGDIKTTKDLVDLDVIKYFIPDFNMQDKKNLVDLIKSKLENIELLLSNGIAYVPSPWFIEKSTFTNGLFKVTFTPGGEVTTTLMIYPAGVRAWSPSPNTEGSCPLHFICSLPEVPTEVVKFLLDCNPADINQKSKTGFTALIIAIIRKNYPLVKFLIEKGASMELAPAMDVKMEEVGSYYPYIKVFSAVEVNFPQMYYYLTPVDAAVVADNEDILRYLVRRGADVNVNHGLWNCLFHPIMMGRRRMVETLLQSGVSVNDCDLLGGSPLHRAAGEGHFDLTFVLMRYGAQVNARDEYGWTPLHVACLFSRTVFIEMIQLLLDNGADVGATTRFGFAPLSLVEAGHDQSFLRYLAANIDILGNIRNHNCSAEEDSGWQHENIMNLLLDSGASCNQQDDILGWTALHWAAAAGDLRTVRLLVSRGARVSIKSKFRFNAYQTALVFNRRAVSAFLMTVTDETS